jgi:hypothetical protein
MMKIIFFLPLLIFLYLSLSCNGSCMMILGTPLLLRTSSFCMCETSDRMLGVVPSPLKFALLYLTTTKQFLIL